MHRQYLIIINLWSSISSVFFSIYNHRIHQSFSLFCTPSFVTHNFKQFHNLNNYCESGIWFYHHQLVPPIITSRFVLLECLAESIVDKVSGFFNIDKTHTHKTHIYNTHIQYIYTYIQHTYIKYTYTYSQHPYIIYTYIQHTYIKYTYT